MKWQGDNPYYLMCVDADYGFGGAGGPIQQIDLDERGWATTHEKWMRQPGEWHLVRKDDTSVVLSLKVLTGDQPYYTSRVFGSTSSGGKLIRAYGIGKKQADSTMLRLWVLENGLVCGGDDVDIFGPEALK